MSDKGERSMKEGGKDERILDGNEVHERLGIAFVATHSGDGAPDGFSDFPFSRTRLPRGLAGAAKCTATGRHDVTGRRR